MNPEIKIAKSISILLGIIAVILLLDPVVTLSLFVLHEYNYIYFYSGIVLGLLGIILEFRKNNTTGFLGPLFFISTILTILINIFHPSSFNGELFLVALNVNVATTIILCAISYSTLINQNFKSTATAYVNKYVLMLCCLIFWFGFIYISGSAGSCSGEFCGLGAAIVAVIFLYLAVPVSLIWLILFALELKASIKRSLLPVDDVAVEIKDRSLISSILIPVIILIFLFGISHLIFFVYGQATKVRGCFKEDIDCIAKKAEDGKNYALCDQAGGSDFTHDMCYQNLANILTDVSFCGRIKTNSPGQAEECIKEVEKKKPEPSSCLSLSISSEVKNACNFYANAYLAKQKMDFSYCQKAEEFAIGDLKEKAGKCNYILTTLKAISDNSFYGCDSLSGNFIYFCYDAYSFVKKDCSVMPEKYRSMSACDRMISDPKSYPPDSYPESVLFAF